MLYSTSKILDFIIFFTVVEDCTNLHLHGIFYITTQITVRQDLHKDIRGGEHTTLSPHLQNQEKNG